VNKSSAGDGPLKRESTGALLIATSNQGKVREVRAVLSSLSVDLIGLCDVRAVDPPEEHGETFKENAIAKALYYARATRHLTLADDSGLEVDVLGGAPGIHSARYAGPGCDDKENNAKLIAALAGVPAERRTARFRCTLVLADAVEVRACTVGVIEGLIIDQARGANGFGYDPHFFVPGFGSTTAEMTPAQKNRISHRGRALAAMVPLLERLLRDGTCG